MSYEVDCWFCENCGVAFVVREGFRMNVCWNCGTPLERLVDMTEAENSVLAHSLEPGDVEDQDEGGENDSLTIPPG